jgi:hypothetical protein
MPPDEVHGSVQGPNGERLQLQLGSKSFGVSAKDLVSVLLVVVMGVGFYLTVNSLTDRLDRGNLNQEEGFRKLEKLTELTHVNQAAMLAALQQNRDVTGNLIREQNELLRQQTEQLTKNQAGIVDGLHQQTGHVRQWFAVLLHKLQHPDQPISLDIPLPQERGR